jgi:hypothetical protein
MYYITVDRRYLLRRPDPDRDRADGIIGIVPSAMGDGLEGVDSAADAGRDLSVEVGEQFSPPWSMNPKAQHLWLSTPTLPTSGGDLAVAVLNPTDRPLHYGLGGSFEHWDGAAWVGAGYWAGSLSNSGQLGWVSEKPKPVAAIGLGADPRRAGAVEYLTVPALASGWYRFGVLRAYAVLRVGLDAPSPIEITNTPAFTTHPTLIPATGAVVRLDSSPIREMRPGTYAQLVKTLSPFVALESLHPGGWVQVTRLEVHPVDVVGGRPIGSAVTIPPLPAGCHRIVRISPMLGPLHRHIWALEPPAGIVLDPPHDS